MEQVASVRWLRLGLGLGLVSTLGCSLGNIETEPCSSDAQCQAAFGALATCGGLGFCVIDEEGCEVETPGPEVPYDGVDNDCDPATPDDDLDGDGFPVAEDCDDQDEAIHLDGTLAVGVVSSEQVASLCEARCPAMTVLQGTFALVEPLDDLGGLECLTEIDGTLRLEGSGAASLGGLANLTRVRGDLVIDNEDALSDLSGLDRLEEVDGALRIVDNAELLDVTAGLDELLRVGGDLEITDNPRVPAASATALESRIVVLGAVELANNGDVLQFVNAGFEEETFRAPDEWLVFPEKSLNGTAALLGDPYPGSSATFEPRTGNAALRIVADETVDVVTTTTIYQEHFDGFAAGEEFELAGWAWVSSEEPLGEGCLGYLAIKYFDDAFVFRGLSASEVVDASSAPDTWTRLAVRSRIPATATIVQGGAELSFDGSCGGSVYFDDLELRKVANPAN